MGWCWYKYYRNPKYFFVLPKNNNYINYPVLINAFNAINIDCSKANVERIEGKEKYLYDDK